MLKNALVTGKQTQLIGRNHKGAIITLVERKSKYTLLRKVNRKTSHAVNTAISEMAKGIKERFIAMTVVVNLPVIRKCLRD